MLVDTRFQMEGKEQREPERQEGDSPQFYSQTGLSETERSAQRGLGLRGLPG